MTISMMYVKPRGWGILLALLFGAVCPRLAQAQDETGFPQTPGFHGLKFQTIVDGRPIQMAYSIYIPKTYETDKFARPMVLFLHGVGECGSDLSRIFVHGPAAELQRHTDLQETFQSIVLSPQCPAHGERWDQVPMLKAVLALMDVVQKEWRVDATRVYVTGLSMGGKGSWLLSELAHDRFAAIAPMSADTVRQDVVNHLQDMPVWGVAGGDDGSCVAATTAMLQKLGDGGDEVRLSIMPHLGHDGNLWTVFYACPQFYEWLIDHSRNASGHSVRADALRTPGHHLLQFQPDPKTLNNPLAYTLYLPKDYTPLGKPHPLLIYFHPLGIEGTLAGGFCLHGPELELERPDNEAMKAHFPFVVISPQFMPPGGRWSDDQIATVSQLLDEVFKKYNVDKSRVYVSGTQEGAAATWALALHAPDQFAAILPVVTHGPAATQPSNAAQSLKDIAIWSFIRADDTAGINATKALFSVNRASTNLQTVQGDHLSDPDDCYGQRELYDWLLQRHHLITH